MFHHAQSAIAESTISTYIPAAATPIRFHLLESSHASETSQ